MNSDVVIAVQSDGLLDRQIVELLLGLLDQRLERWW